MQQVKYAIANKTTGDLLTCYNSSNAGSDFCVEFECTLSESKYDPTWYNSTVEGAFYALHHNTPWYNADEDTPSHGVDISPETHKVVKVIVVTTVEDV